MIKDYELKENNITRIKQNTLWKSNSSYDGEVYLYLLCRVPGGYSMICLGSGNPENNLVCTKENVTDGFTRVYGTVNLVFDFDSLD